MKKFPVTIEEDDSKPYTIYLRQVQSGPRNPTKVWQVSFVTRHKSFCCDYPTQREAVEWAQNTLRAIAIEEGL